jgi:hypothetical protein
MDSSPDDEFDRKYDLLKHEIDRAEDLRKSFQGATNTSASNININAGGVGVYIAATCCAVMLAVNLFLIAIIVNHERKIDDLGDYIHAIYMVAPSLKPESKK